jgi:methylglutamate dehydrogenase subunit D
VADVSLKPSSAFMHWKTVAQNTLAVSTLENVTMASIAVSKGRSADLQSEIEKNYGVALPERPARVQGRGIAFVWAGPGQWLAVADRQQGRDLETELKPLLNGLASVVDQSDGRVIVRMSGKLARDVLAKGVPIDLDPRAFKPGDAAITHASHIGIMIWQIDERPAYELAMFRSYADSFAHWLAESAAEYMAL